MSTLKIPTAKIFEPLLAPARYKGVYGGRGSGKSHFFGELLVETCEAEPGTRAVCIREAQKTLAQSSKRLIESKIASLGLSRRFRIYSDRIATPGDGIIIFRGMQNHTADSIKSLEGFRIAWIDEAQSLSARSLALLRPTIRLAGSELWASWNPYNIPLFGGMDFWDTVAPNSSFIFPAGQAISRVTYAAAFARWGTKFGTGDGSTTFNVPDKTGRVSAMLESVGTRLTTSGSGIDGGTLGSVGGNQNVTIAQSGLPNIVPAFAGSTGTINVTSAGNFGHANGLIGGVTTGSGNAVAFDNSAVQSPVTSSGSFTPSGTVASINGNVTQTATKTVQVPIVCNYVIRIL
jgi:microcystin-dependent protein